MHLPSQELPFFFFKESLIVSRTPLQATTFHNFPLTCNLRNKALGIIPSVGATEYSAPRAPTNSRKWHRVGQPRPDHIVPANKVEA